MIKPLNRWLSSLYKDLSAPIGSYRIKLDDSGETTEYSVERKVKLDSSNSMFIEIVWKHCKNFSSLEEAASFIEGRKQDQEKEERKKLAKNKSVNYIYH